MADPEVEDEDEFELPETIDTTIPIQKQIEQAISEGLSSDDLTMKMKAATLAAKCGMIKAIDRNIKISPVSEKIVDILLMLMIEHGLKLEDLMIRMGTMCRDCQKLNIKLHPKVKV